MGRKMKILLTILLFPIFSHAQFAAGVAQYTAERAIKFGMLVNSATLTNPAKAAITKDSFNCNYARTALTVETWDGSSSRIQTYKDSGLIQYVVINYKTGDSIPFVTASQLSGYADTVTDMLETYPYPTIQTIAVENEEINKGQHTGPLSDYGGMLQTVYPIAHARNILVTDGGFYGAGLRIKVYRWLQTKYGVDGQDSADAYGERAMTAGQISAAQTPNSNPSLEAEANQIDTIFMYKDYVDYFNIHAYEVFSQTNTMPDTVKQISTNVLMWQRDYVEETTGKPCITNETGQRTNEQPELVTNMLAEYYRLGFFIVQWYNGTGDADARPLSNQTTGETLPNGTAFKNYVSTHQ